MKEKHIRKPNRLKGFDYSQNGAYYVTICAKDRANLFGQIVGAAVPGKVNGASGAKEGPLEGHQCMLLTELGQCVEDAIQWYTANIDEAVFDTYVVMPNHIHAIIVIRPETGDRGRSPLQYIVRRLKSYVTKQIGFSPWQKSFHDHIIRSEQDYIRIAEYIETNPEKWEEDCFYQK